MAKTTQATIVTPDYKSAQYLSRLKRILEQNHKKISNDLNNLTNKMSSQEDLLNGIIDNFVKPAWKNLTAKTNTSNPNYQVDLAFDALRVEDIYLESKSFTLDITASGDNGLDTGSEAVSTWYYIWIFADSEGNAKARLSASATAPVAPLGYDRKIIASYVYNDASGNFRMFRQNGKDYLYSTLYQIYSHINNSVNVSDTGATAIQVDLASYIPDGILKTKLMVQQAAVSVNISYNVIGRSAIGLGGSIAGKAPSGALALQASSGDFTPTEDEWQYNLYYNYFGGNTSYSGACRSRDIELLTENKILYLRSYLYCDYPITTNHNVRNVIYVRGFKVPLGRAA